jgi:hypothetical protein
MNAAPAASVRVRVGLQQQSWSMRFRPRYIAYRILTTVFLQQPLLSAIAFALTDSVTGPARRSSIDGVPYELR